MYIKVCKIPDSWGNFQELSKSWGETYSDNTVLYIRNEFSNFLIFIIIHLWEWIFHAGSKNVLIVTIYDKYNDHLFLRL